VFDTAEVQRKMEMVQMRKMLMVASAAVLLWTVSVFAQNTSTSMAVSTASSATQQSHFTNAPTFSERYPRYKVSTSDTFDMIFEYTPEWNQTVVVQPDGYITARGIGDVYVNGLTVQQVQDKLQESYNKILNKPSISINMRDFQKPYFIADGMVNRPGKYELRGDTTAVQALAMAGGFNSQYAKHSKVVLFRRIDDTWVETKTLDVKSMEKSGNLSEDVHLRPGDMLFVPKNAASKFQQWIPIYSVNVLGAESKAF